MNQHPQSNLSILTNFGCLYSCEFCISSSQNSKNGYRFKLQDARDIRNLLKSGKYERLSISGGGDPLYIYNKDIILLYKFIIKNSDKFNIHLSFHTNFDEPPIRIRKLLNRYLINFVISVHKEDWDRKFFKWSEEGYYSKNLRFAYVIGYNSNDLEIIESMLKYLPQDAKLTLKQLDGTILEEIPNIQKIRELIRDNQRCIILESGEYNTYYNLKDNKIYDKFKDINWN
jgi:organic radical activating enzyme